MPANRIQKNLWEHHGVEIVIGNKQMTTWKLTAKHSSLTSSFHLLTEHLNAGIPHCWHHLVEGCEIMHCCLGHFSGALVHHGHQQLADARHLLQGVAMLTPYDDVGPRVSDHVLIDYVRLRAYPHQRASTIELAYAHASFTPITGPLIANLTPLILTRVVALRMTPMVCRVRARLLGRPRLIGRPRLLGRPLPVRGALALRVHFVGHRGRARAPGEIKQVGWKCGSEMGPRSYESDLSDCVF
jgi:hypothetical protein